MATKTRNEKQRQWWENHQKSQVGPATFVGDTIALLAYQLDLVTRVRFPSDTFQRHPVKFFQDILGVEPWKKQIEVLEAIRDYPRVAVKSGHKVSKSNTAAGSALWFYCSWQDSRVVMTSVTSRQVDAILWRELKMMRARGGRCIACKVAMMQMAEHCSMQQAEAAFPKPCPHSAHIEGELGEQARTGLKSNDFREIVGFTAREAEAVAGISGANLLYLPDEASGIAQAIFEAIEGNRAGGARLAMFSNPTRNEGEFYDAFNTKKNLYKTVTISSEETPNCVQNIENLIPGLANPSWIREKEEEWGRDSALFKVRVKGEFAEMEEGKAFSIHTIQQAEQRWHDMDETYEIERLYIGIDPAGPTGSGDESCFSARRGYKQMLVRTFRGLTEETHLVHLLAMIGTLQRPREPPPIVVLDREGKIGSALMGTLHAFLQERLNKDKFELFPVRASDRAFRESHIYDRVRDELASNLENWFRNGGGIIEDTKLSAELHAFEWETALNGRLKLTAKEKIRKLLGRSPDRFDALCLSVWEPASVGAYVGTNGDIQALAEIPGVPTIDPYSGMDAFRS